MCSYTPKYADQLTLKQMHDQQISNQRRSHTVRFLCCFAVTIANNIEACAYLSPAIFCRHCRDVRSDVWHGSTISSADFLRKLNHAHNSRPTLSIVWLLLYSPTRELMCNFWNQYLVFQWRKVRWRCSRIRPTRVDVLLQKKIVTLVWQKYSHCVIRTFSNLSTVCYSCCLPSCRHLWLLKDTSLLRNA